MRIRFIQVVGSLVLCCCSNQMPSTQGESSSAAPSSMSTAPAGSVTPNSASPAPNTTNKPSTSTPSQQVATAGTAAAVAAGSSAKPAAAAGGAGATANMPMTTAGAGGAGATAPAAMSGASAAGAPTTGASTFDQCVAALQPMCGYDQKMVACSSLMTASIPLTNGMTWGNLEIEGGPYGAFVEWNQGADFKNPVNESESSCDLLAATFGEPAEVTADTLDLRGGDLSLYTIFRPACMHDGETFPVITWGNGTCGQSGSYAGLLATVASYGFVVIAANSRFTDAGNKEMLRALDLAKTLNEQEGSVFYKRLDLDKVGAMGHSQGSSATANASSDPRIKAVILWNGGLSVTTKPFLAVSGDRDIGGYTPADMSSAVQGSSLPAAFLYFHQVLETGGNVTGHLTLMEQPERVWKPTVAWWKYMLNGDEEAKKMFLGADCGLCNQKEAFEYGANANLK